MDINDVSQVHLEGILKQRAVPIIEVIKKNPITTAFVRPEFPPGPSDRAFSIEWLTSHDLVNMLNMLSEKIDRFADKVQDALKELD